MGKIEFDTIESAVESIRKGKLVIVVDDEDRENEGDFIGASELVSPEMINFMSKNGRGLICIALTRSRCEQLGLDLMVPANVDVHHTPFTVSVDFIDGNVSTGISAQDRAETIRALADKKRGPTDFARPGHIFPLRGREEGVLRRSGHTEASIDLARMAGLYPSGLLVEILNEDGTMARLPQLRKIADNFDLSLICIRDLITHRLKNETLIEEIVSVNLPTRYGNFSLRAFKQNFTGDIHMALLKGELSGDKPVMVRVHSSCITGDIFASRRCDCGQQLTKAMEMIEQEGEGVLIYMKQEGRGIGLENKLRSYKLQEKGLDTVDANLHLGFSEDSRDYGIGAQILRSMGVRKIRLVSNNPAKRVGLKGYGLEIVENIPLVVTPNPHNSEYLSTKKEKMGHDF